LLLTLGCQLLDPLLVRPTLPHKVIIPTGSR
jgi:hypothetical protein